MIDPFPWSPAGGPDGLDPGAALPLTLAAVLLVCHLPRPGFLHSANIFIPSQGEHETRAVNHTP